jgi:hypothetical protein
MNHYQKLATVLVRGAGMATTALGLLGALYGAFFIARGGLTPNAAERFYASFWYVVAGIVVFALGRHVGRLLGRGLD